MSKKSGAPKKSMIDLKRLEQLMGRKGWGTGELATYSGVKYDTIYSIRAARRTNTTSQTLRKIAEVLDTTTDYLLGESDDPRPPVSTLPEKARAVAVVAARLSEVRQEELVRIAEVLEKFEREEAERNAEEDARQIAEFQAAMNVYERKYGTEATDDLIAILAANFPELRAFVRPFGPAEKGKRNEA